MGKEKKAAKLEDFIRKRLLSVLLTCCMLSAMLPASALAVELDVPKKATVETTPNGESVQEGRELAALSDDDAASDPVTGGDIYFNSETGAITGCDETVTAVNIPASIDGVAVTSIGQEAFYGCSSLSSVTIPASVTSIGDSAFKNCSSLDSITIPNSVTSIGDDTFWNCSSLSSITIPDGVTSISDAAFFDCSGLASITIPASVTRISGSAFHGCRSLSSITIPNSVISIGNDAFWNCSSLSSITIPANVTSIGEWAFCGCSGLTSLAIPASVTSIGGSAFQECSSLTSITIPNSVTSIGSGTFSRCSGLTSLTIPASVTSIGSNAFYACSGLTSLTIPASVTSIGGSAFQECSKLTSITIPNGVTSIGSGTFASCHSLSSLTIPASVTSIGDWAFYGCNNLKTVYYGGSEADRANIKIINENGADTPLLNANWVYNYKIPEAAAPVQAPATNIAYASTQTVNVDGKVVSFQMYALKDASGNPTNYIKVRDLASVLNGTKAQFNVGYDGSVNLIPGAAYIPNGSEMSTPFSGDRAYTQSKSPTKVNGTASNLDAIVLTDDAGGGYTYYKLRDLGQALGFTVDWSKEKGVFIETGTL